MLTQPEAILPVLIPLTTLCRSPAWRRRPRGGGLVVADVRIDWLVLTYTEAAGIVPHSASTCEA